MDKLILGLLMLKRLTVYEIRGIIRKNFGPVCSDSLGSIQAAIKKLLAAQMVTCSEYVEKSVNKKQYSITDHGREEFLAWLEIPADMSNSKNMEFGKLLFMGLMPSDKRPALIDEIIALLEKELSGLLALQSSIRLADGIRQAVASWEDDPEYRLGIEKVTQNPDIAENAKDIGDFEMLALQYSIDFTSFQIGWFNSLREKIKAGNKAGRKI